MLMLSGAYKHNEVENLSDNSFCFVGRSNKANEFSKKIIANDVS